ncbi:MAG: hypothetical protein IJM64_01485 [Ottowia sp.]|nr:hypothetical protein [Ottowia sp.]
MTKGETAMHILAALLTAAVIGVLAFGALRALLPLLIHFITAASLAIILVWLTTTLLPYSIVLWLIAAGAIAAYRDEQNRIQPHTAPHPAPQLRLPTPAATARH